jgi:choline dehydrogenase-like flavoprotein
MGLLYGLLERQQQDNNNKVDSMYSILVVERGSGSKPPPPYQQDPRQWPWAAHSNDTAVCYQTMLGNRFLDLPVGLGMGGSTNINACLVTDNVLHWEDSTNTTSSTSSTTSRQQLHAMQTIEDALRRHGALIELETSLSHLQAVERTTEPQHKVSIQNKISYSIKAHPTILNSWTRVSYYQGLVKPLLLEQNPQHNITFWTDTLVQRLVWNDTEIVGVDCMRHDGTLVRVQGEVILCAGAFGTPALLLASGMGPRRDLQQSCRLDCPVGQGLMDHVLIPRIFLKSPFRKHPTTLSPSCVQALITVQPNTNNFDKECFQYMVTDAAATPYLLPQLVASLVFRRPCTFPSTTRVRNLLHHATKWILWCCISYTPLYFITRYCLVVLNVVLLTPESRGTIRLKRIATHRRQRRGDVDLDITNLYLSDPADVGALQRAWTLADHVCAPWIQMVGWELTKIVSWKQERFQHYLQLLSLPYYHFGGSCGQVVKKDEFIIMGVPGLRLCDASILTELPRGPTALTCAGLGYRLAHVLLRNHNNDNNKKKQE